MGNITNPTELQTADAAGEEGHSTFAQVIAALADGSIPAVKVAGTGNVSTDLDQQAGTTAPTTRGDGTSALQIGDTWFNQTEKADMIWDGTQWIPASGLMEATAAGTDSLGNTIAVGDDVMSLADGSTVNLDALGGGGAVTNLRGMTTAEAGAIRTSGTFGSNVEITTTAPTYVSVNAIFDGVDRGIGDWLLLPTGTRYGHINNNTGFPQITINGAAVSGGGVVNNTRRLGAGANAFRISETIDINTYVVSGAPQNTQTATVLDSDSSGRDGWRSTFYLPV